MSRARACLGPGRRGPMGTAPARYLAERYREMHAGPGGLDVAAPRLGARTATNQSAGRPAGRHRVSRDSSPAARPRDSTLAMGAPGVGRRAPKPAPGPGPHPGSDAMGQAARPGAARQAPQSPGRPAGPGRRPTAGQRAARRRCSSPERDLAATSSPPPTNCAPRRGRVVSRPGLRAGPEPPGRGPVRIRAGRGTGGGGAETGGLTRFAMRRAHEMRSNRPTTGRIGRSSGSTKLRIARPAGGHVHGAAVCPCLARSVRQEAPQYPRAAPPSAVLIRPCGGFISVAATLLSSTLTATVFSQQGACECDLF